MPSRTKQTQGVGVSEKVIATLVLLLITLATAGVMITSSLRASQEQLKSALTDPKAMAFIITGDSLKSDSASSEQKLQAASECSDQIAVWIQSFEFVSLSCVSVALLIGFAYAIRMKRRAYG